MGTALKFEHLYMLFYINTYVYPYEFTFLSLHSLAGLSPLNIGRMVREIAVLLGLMCLSACETCSFYVFSEAMDMLVHKKHTHTHIILFS